MSRNDFIHLSSSNQIEASVLQDMIAGYLQDCIDIGVVGFRVDAAKHMWPEDIKNTIAKADTAFYVHEVIDQGGEPIKVQEYFGVGRVTEFRYGIKVGESVRNKDYGALGGVYDQVIFETKCMA